MAERSPVYLQGIGIDAIEDRLQLESIWGEGAEGLATPNSFKLTAGGGMSVTISSGRGIIYSDVAFNGSYHVVSDGNKVLNFSASHATQWRRDAVIARVKDMTLVPGDGANSFTLEVVQGSNSGSNNPPLPTLPSRSILLHDLVFNPTATSPSLITDRRVMAKAKEWSWQDTQVAPDTINADSNSYKFLAGFAVDEWPAWVQAGGGLCHHQITMNGSQVAASEVEMRGIIGNTIDNALVATDAWYYEIRASGFQAFYVGGEFILPATITSPFTQLQVRRVGSQLTALRAAGNQTRSTHRIRVVERPIT